MKTFILTDSEHKKAEKWIKNHKCKAKEKMLPCSIKYIFIPTGIADCVEIKCTGCKKKLDLTDVSTW